MVLDAILFYAQMAEADGATVKKSCGETRRVKKKRKIVKKETYMDGKYMRKRILRG